MNFKHLISSADQWHSHETAPKDGTPIFVDENGSLGIYAWEDRPEYLAKNVHGKSLPPTWIGILVRSDLNGWYDEENDAPIEDRFMTAYGLEEPFLWRPLPARSPQTAGYDCIREEYDLIPTSLGSALVNMISITETIQEYLADGHSLLLGHINAHESARQVLEALRPGASLLVPVVLSDKDFMAAYHDAAGWKVRHELLLDRINKMSTPY